MQDLGIREGFGDWPSIREYDYGCSLGGAFSIGNMTEIMDLCIQCSDDYKARSSSVM